jgi:MoxR-like ATPase
MDNFEKMVSATGDLMNPNINHDLQISTQEINAWHTEIDKVSVPREVLDVIQYIRNQLREYNEKLENEEERIVVSDRRWKKIVNLLRACAFLNGRNKIDLMDTFLISHCVWNEPDQIPQVTIIVRDAIRNHGYKKVIETEVIEHAIEKLSKEVDTETHFVKKTPVKELVIKNVKGKSCYKIKSFSNEYCYVKKSIFDSMKTNSEKSVELTNGSGKRYVPHYGTYITKKSKKSLIYDDKNYNLEEQERIDETIETKKPHQAVLNTWNKEVENIKGKIDIEKKKLDEYVNVDLLHVKSNIFVPQENSNVVLNKIEDLKNILDQLEIRLLNIKDAYTNIS